MIDLLNYIVWNPDLEAFRLGPLAVRWYGLMWIIGLALAYFVVKRLYKEQKIKDEYFDPLFIYCFFGILSGCSFALIPCGHKYRVIDRGAELYRADYDGGDKRYSRVRVARKPHIDKHREFNDRYEYDRQRYRCSRAHPRWTTPHPRPRQATPYSPRH